MIKRDIFLLFFSNPREFTARSNAKNQKSLAAFIPSLLSILEARLQSLFTKKNRHAIFKTITFTIVWIPREIFGLVTCGFLHWKID